jgi:hypothetical protein
VQEDAPFVEHDRLVDGGAKRDPLRLDVIGAGGRRLHRERSSLVGEGAGDGRPLLVEERDDDARHESGVGRDRRAAHDLCVRRRNSQRRNDEHHPEDAHAGMLAALHQCGKVFALRLAFVNYSERRNPCCTKPRNGSPLSRG